MLIDAGFFHQWSSKGHELGRCQSHPSSDLMYVKIPKNASSWTNPLLKEDWGWKFYNYHTDKIDKTAIVVLRDPVDRWITGIAEYLASYHPTIVLDKSGSLDLIFDRVVFDDHTERQVNFIHGLETDRCIFLWCDSNYRQNFSDLLTEHGMPNEYFNYDYQNASETNSIRKRFKQLFSREIENSKYMQSIKNYFEADYQLINQVKFYGTR